MLDVEDRMDLPRGRKVKLARVTATHAYNTVRAKPSRSHLGNGKRSVAEVDRVARREFERFARGVVMRLLLRLRIDDCAFSCVEDEMPKTKVGNEIWLIIQSDKIGGVQRRRQTGMLAV